MHEATTGNSIHHKPCESNVTPYITNHVKINGITNSDLLNVST